MQSVAQSPMKMKQVTINRNLDEVRENIGSSLRHQPSVTDIRRKNHSTLVGSKGSGVTFDNRKGLPKIKDTT